MTAMLELAQKGIETLVTLQKEAIIAADQAGPADLDSLKDAFQ